MTFVTFGEALDVYMMKPYDRLGISLKYFQP